MKPTTTRKFYLEWKRPDGWWRIHVEYRTLALAKRACRQCKQFWQPLTLSQQRVVEEIIKIHKL